MGSFKGNGRDKKPGRRFEGRGNRQRSLALEALEMRTLLTGGGNQVAPTWQPTTTNLLDLRNGPLAKAGEYLDAIYFEYQHFLQSGGTGTFTSTLSKVVDTHGDLVNVDARGWGNFSNYVTSLRDIGMQVAGVDPTTETVEGYLPINEVPAVAEMVQTVGVDSNFYPVAHSQGLASNQSELTLKADVAKKQFNVTGAGVTIGVMSTSANQFGGGLAASQKTGDLPSNVTIIKDPTTGLPEDGPAGSSDEGRAMMEQIYDIAPGAQLQFATAFTGDVLFAQHIHDLANAGSNIIVDDIGYANEPFFQDGIIAQAVTSVTNTQNVNYFSAAGNSANSGYQSLFRGVNTTVTGVGAGRFMNFNPGGGTLAQLPITVTQPGLILLQWDNPFYTTNGVTTELDLYVLDSNGNVVASGTANSVASQMPEQIANVASTGNYTIAILVKQGPDPSRLMFTDFNGNGMTVSQQFGTAGGTFYPTTFGHSAAAEAISTGAVPWWAATPFQAFNPTPSEVFSSFGPQVTVFGPTGNRLAQPVTRLKPDLSAPDGNDTTFFIPGLFLSTVNPPPATGPATTVEYDGNTLPNFFGTSSAAPNLAAVGALMRQLVPGLTTPAMRAAMIASASPLNGASAGTWNQQGGYGLVDASKALAAISMLRVVATTPTNGAIVTTAPSTIIVTFSKPVDPTTLSSADITFTSEPPGVTASPVAGVAPTVINPTTVAFPIDIEATGNIKANGLYQYTIGGPIRSADGQPLVPFSASFTLNDTSAPRVTNVTLLGRIIVINFDKGMRPSTINRNNIILVRTGSSGVFGNPTNVIINSDPRMTIFYDAVNNRAIINLSNLDQSELPSDHYALIVKAAATDLVGNQLDGIFSGVYPSGNGFPGSDFVLDLPNQQVQAPLITSLRLTEPGDVDANGKPLPVTDSGIPFDQNTRITTPELVGFVITPFPGTFQGVSIEAQFNGLAGGTLTLGVNPTGRGFSGTPDASYTSTITAGNGEFVIQAPGALPDGFNTVRVVATGAPDSPPLPGFSSSRDQTFRVDTSDPTILSTSVLPGSTLNSLTTLSLNVTDPVFPLTIGSPLAVPTQFGVPALNPSTADNIANYSLINLGTSGVLGAPDNKDYSNFITAANFVSTTVRANTNDPYTGTVTLTIAPGLPSGTYELVAHTVGTTSAPGLTDAAGNPLSGTPGLPGLHDFTLKFFLQPVAAYITQMALVSPTPTPGGPSVSYYGPRAYFQIPSPGFAPDAPAPPTAINIDFSNPLDPTKNYSNVVELLRTANTALSPADGDFGPNGVSGASIVQGLTVQLTNSVAGAVFGQPGFQNRLVVSLPANLLPDHYRIYLPNTGTQAIFDLFGNQLDGEFRGNPTPQGSLPGGFLPPTTAPEPGLQFEDLLPNGQYRQGLSGDGTPGGAFETTFTVVPPTISVVKNGVTTVVRNIIYARPDYVEDPNLPSTAPDGSISKPFSALAPEAIANALNGGDLNSVVNFGIGFNPALDRNGNGTFDRSALFAAQLASTRGPVVVVALPGVMTPQGQKTFVLQAPSGPNAVLNDASVSVPFDTALVFAPGSAVKLQNASILVQNQGSSLMALGGPNPSQQVNFTSYADDTVGGPSRPPGNTSAPQPGNWGGIVFRNFDQLDHSTVQGFAVDGTLKGNGGINPQQLAVSGADDALSLINFANIKFAGGVVPQTTGFRYDAVTSFGSRPFLSNDNITKTGGAGTQAAISGDLDSFRQDDLSMGMEVRRTTVSQNSLNGIWIRPELNGVAEETNAIIYPNNPSIQGGTQNFVLDSNLPYILTSQLFIGTILDVSTAEETEVANRFYIQPGMMVKLVHGAGIDVLSLNASINVGDRTYINEWDLNHNISPADPNFKAPTVGNAQVLFTSLYDDAATTSFFDPNTNQTTTIVPAISSSSGPAGVLQPTPTNVPFQSQWGSVMVQSGALAVIHEATFRYGGGPTNSPEFTFPTQSVLAFTTFEGFSRFGTFNLVGTRAFITDNNFDYNYDTPMQIEPDGLMAGDPDRPLNSGHPFFRGNLMVGNTINGMAVVTSRGWITNPANPVESIPFELIGARGFENLDVNSVWDSTDLTYVLRGSVVLGAFSGIPVGDPQVLTAQLKPSLTLTLQSALPGTVLADGSTIPKPGEPLVVKMLSDQPTFGNGVTGSQGVGDPQDTWVGAGFLVGADNNIDPPTDSLIDPGAGGQLRFVGVGGNETTGQTREPVILTSLNDNTVGTTVRGVKMFQAVTGSTATAAPGNWGNIYFGGNSLPTYNFNDPRQGNILYNTDVRFGTRIEAQGGGLVSYKDINGDNGFGQDDIPFIQKTGVNPVTGVIEPDLQNNSAETLTIADSNIASFSQVGVLTVPGYNQLALALNFPQTPNPARFGFDSEPVYLYMYNSTISNTPVGVRMVGQAGNDTASPSPMEGVFLQNTFYNDTVGIQTSAQVYNGLNDLAHVTFVAMDNIFDHNSQFAISTNGLILGTNLQYNLFHANGQDLSIVNEAVYIVVPVINNGAIQGDPQFLNASGGDFRIGPNSAAIDSGRSEIGPLPGGDMLLPTSTQLLNSTLGIKNSTGRTNFVGGEAFITDSQAIVTLPGWPLRTYVDQFVPVIPGTPGSVPGGGNDAGNTYAWLPIQGERDQLGFLRVKDPNSSNIGFGSRPFFDIGAFEFRQFFPPHVIADPTTGDGAKAVVTDPKSPTGTSTIDLYSVGGVSGSNKPIQSIQIAFDAQLDPNTINDKTVILEESGGDGIFGNANSSLDRTIDLAGRLSFDPIAHILTINMAGLNLPSDEYRIILDGNGSDVIRDPQGNALDGENTLNDDPNNPQLALPSGDGFPGGNFYLTFLFDTNIPKLVPGTLVLDPATDSNIRDGITNIANPTFDGVIMDTFPPAPAAVGETVILDISTKGNGVYDRMNAGTAITKPIFDAQGNLIPNEASFQVTVNGAALPDSPIVIGASGKEQLVGGDLTGFSTARVRIINQAGNSSNVNDPNNSTAFVVDTHGPRVVSSTPLPNTEPSFNGSSIFVSLNLNKNIDPKSVNTSTVKVIRSGGDGIFGNANDVPVPITGLTLSAPQPFTGHETISFSIPAPLPNDLYEAILVGTGATTVTDIPGNALDGQFNGTFPSGTGTPPSGSDFDLPFAVFNPANSKMVFVGPSQFITDATQPLGTRENPFPTIAAGIKKAQVGDIVAVLPGVYSEVVILKSLVTVESADPSSTDTAFVPGSALQTVIRPPTTGPIVGVIGTNLTSIGQLHTEFAGFTINDPLQGNPANGPINPSSIGVLLVNSNVLIDKDYITDAAYGIDLLTSGAGAPTSTIDSNGVIGNLVGIIVNDLGTTQSLTQPFNFVNNTIAFNTYGIVLFDTSQVPTIAVVDNNIFWQNNDGLPDQAGAAIVAAVSGKTVVAFNLFGPGNGPAGGNPGNIALNVGGGFDPTLLNSTTPDSLGNFTGNPAFVAPRDPRPASDGPAIFLSDADFDLTFQSAAIDNALNTVAPQLDFLSRGRVKINGRGFPGHGPADIGAFEFMGSGGTSTGASFQALTSALVPAGAGTQGLITQSVNSSGSGGVIMSFSRNLNLSSVSPGDLILSGSGLNPLNPAHAVGLEFIDQHTVDFLLSGAFNSSGSVQVSIPAGSIQDSSGDTMPAFLGTITLNQGSGSTQPTGPILKAASAISQQSGAPVAGSLQAQTISAPAAAPLSTARSQVVPLNVAGPQGGLPVSQAPVTVTPNQPRGTGRGLLGLFRSRSKRQG
jgi:large repetitive protein